jgi:hypothetical protein
LTVKCPPALLSFSLIELLTELTAELIMTITATEPTTPAPMRGPRLSG